jgi:hypothetical protein
MLKLHPRKGSDDVYCTMTTVDLNHPGSYVALSYCWGDRTHPSFISLNNNLEPVTANLKGALKHLATEDYIRIWVDAICINQNNDLEKIFRYG